MEMLKLGTELSLSTSSQSSRSCAEELLLESQGLEGSQEMKAKRSNGDGLPIEKRRR